MNFKKAFYWHGILTTGFVKGCCKSDVCLSVRRSISVEKKRN